MYDAVIVGAGPAGSSLGLRMARRGRTCALLERANFPRTKVCGEYLSPAALRELHALGLFAAVAARAHPIRAIALAGFGQGPFELQLPGDGALALPRADLDALLLDAALTAGAQLVRGSYMRSESHAHGVTIAYRMLDGGESKLEAHALVGADGAWSSVATRNGLADEKRRGGRWAVGGHLLGQPDADVLEMFAGEAGYFARNPLGGGRVNQMLVMPHPTLEAEADAVAAAVSDGRRLFHQTSLEKRVAVGPLRYAPRRVMSERVLLTGDAAGLLDPFTGQGVAMALALSAPADRALAALLAGERPRQVARRYANEHRSLVAPRRRLAGAIDALVRVPLLRRSALAKLNRDPAWAHQLLAAVAGAEPADPMLIPKTLLRLA